APSASSSGASAAGTFSGVVPRILATGWTSMRTAGPFLAAGCRRATDGGRLRLRAGADAGGLEDPGDAMLEAGGHDMDAADSRDRQHLLDGLGAQPQPLAGDPVRRHSPQPAA